MSEAAVGGLVVLVCYAMVYIGTPILADQRGRNWKLWLVLTFCLPIIAPMILMLLPVVRVSNRGDTSVAGTTKVSVDNKHVKNAQSSSRLINIDYGPATFTSKFDLTEYQVYIGNIIFGPDAEDIEFFDLSNEEVIVKFNKVARNQYTFYFTGTVNLDDLEDEDEQATLKRVLKKSKNGLQVFFEIEFRKDGDSEPLIADEDFKVDNNHGLVRLI
jgi:hypothetical protein